MRPINEPPRYKRTEAEVWREEMPPEDTSPPEPPPVPRPEDWGVTAEEARAMLQRQMCPVCGEGPWKSPLNHAAKAHGILKRQVREACGLNSVESVVDPELRERFAERGRQADRDMVEIARQPRKKYELTTAGRAALTTNLSTVTAEQSRAALRLAKSPVAQAKRSATLRAKWAAMTPEERAAATNLPPTSSAEQSRRSRLGWERKGLQPCGTRAAYRRGCRCEDCRTAYLAYRREHG